MPKNPLPPSRRPFGHRASVFTSNRINLRDRDWRNRFRLRRQKIKKCMPQNKCVRNAKANRKCKCKSKSEPIERGDRLGGPSKCDVWFRFNYMATFLLSLLVFVAKINSKRVEADEAKKPNDTWSNLCAKLQAKRRPTRWINK